MMTRTQFRNQIAIFLAGRQAEIVVFGEPSNGASQDLRNATEVARRMVMDQGMSGAVAPLSYRMRSDNEWSLSPEYSDRMAEEIDRAVTGIMEAAEGQADRSCALTDPGWTAWPRRSRSGKRCTVRT